MQNKNTVLFNVLTNTAQGLFCGSYSIIPTMHTLFNLSDAEAAIAFSGTILNVATVGTRVRDSFENEVRLIFELLRSTYWGDDSPSSYDRSVELFLHETMRLVLFHCGKLPDETRPCILNRSCQLLIRFADGLHLSTVARPSSGCLAVMLVLEGVTTSVVYAEINGVKLDEPWAVFIDTLAGRILQENRGYSGGPLSKSTAVGHACCSDPIRVLFQKVAFNRNLLKDTQSVHCASLSRLLSSMAMHASEAAARVKSAKTPLQSWNEVNWSDSPGVFKQVHLKRTRLERKYWTTSLLLRKNVHAKAKKSTPNANIDTPPRSPAVAKRPRSPIKIRLAL